jgi:transposase
MSAAPNSLANSTLSSVQLEAVTLLAAGQSIVAVAQHVGVHRATIHNWLNITTG